MEDNSKLLTELIRLAAEKEIPYTPAQVKKMNQETLEQVFKEHQARELDSVNEAFADMAIIKLEELMKNQSWIKPDSQLARKLQERKIFKRDVKNIISYVTPILPFIGLMEGALVIAAEVIDNYAQKKNSDNKTEDAQQDSSPEAPQGEE